MVRQTDLLCRTEWAGGQLLAFSGLDGPTDFECGLVARTSTDGGVDAGRNGVGVDVKWPGLCRLQFPESSGPFLVTGDTLDLNQVRGAFLDAYHLLIEGPCTVSECQREVTVIRQDKRTLVGTTGKLDAAQIAADLDAAMADRARWLHARELPHGLAPTSQRTLAKALSVMKTQVYTPEGVIQHRWTTPDRWPHRAMWLWDSVFHAMGWRHLDITLAREMISAVLDTLRADGFVAHMMTPSRTSAITQPPVLCLGVKLVNDLAPDRDWIEELYPKLCAYVEWDVAHRDSDGAGLVEWFIEGDVNCRSGESGMDNSPRFDAATQQDAVDFNSFLALECETLAGFARLLGRAEEADRWTARHRTLCDLINRRLWNDKEKFYLDFDVERGTPSDVMASTGFLPLICGAASSEQAGYLAQHLHNPDTFGTPLPVPSVARRTHAYAKDMWRGPVWVNVNWLIAYGFDRYGMNDMADELRYKTAREIERTCDKYGTLFEFFDDRQQVEPPQLLRKGKCAPEISPYHQVFHDYGWTATLYADMMFSER